MRQGYKARTQSKLCIESSLQRRILLRICLGINEINPHTNEGQPIQSSDKLAFVVSVRPLSNIY